MKLNPGWEELGPWLDSIDLSGPTPGLFRLDRDGRVHPLRVHIADLAIDIDADHDRLIDEARD